MDHQQFFDESHRRKFLKQLLTGSLATLAIPAFSNFSKTSAEADRDVEFLLAGDTKDEAYWEMVKKQFAVPSNLIMFNAANLCPSPYAINELVETSMKDLSKDVSFQFRSQFATKRARSLEMLAQFVNVSKEEIGIVRNTSEGNTIIVNGLDFQPGDEILLWDQNHPSNNAAWDVRAKRTGIVIKKISMPEKAISQTSLVAAFSKAITPKTKLIAFSHISNTSGMALPAKEICQLAKVKKILTLVDGAQSLGAIDVNLKVIGCDFYTASTHKWLMGPLENGVVYVSKEQLGLVSPGIISAGWKDTSTTTDEKLCVVGQRNETTPFALPETLEFHQAIGLKNIHDRIKKLTEYLKGQIVLKVPQALFVSPISSELTAGITIVTINGKETQDVYQKLYDTNGIACAPSGGGIRMSPHIYNTLADVDKVVAALATLATA